MQLSATIRRIGNGTVNSYLVDDGGEITIVDAGLSGYWRDLPGELASMGRTLADVRSVVLTHGHSDHIGFAERIRRERRVPIRIEELDAALARGEAKNPAPGLRPYRATPLLQFLVYTALRGGLRIPPIREVITFGDGATLDVPGAPRVIHLPGHTPGSAALHFPRHDALFVGDAVATFAVTTGVRGPQLAPFTADPSEALRSLDRLEGIEAGWLLPGHGEAWTDGVAAAIERVRRSRSAATA